MSCTKAVMVLVGAYDSTLVQQRARLYEQHGWVTANSMEDEKLQRALAPENVRGGLWWVKGRDYTVVLPIWPRLA